VAPVVSVLSPANWSSVAAPVLVAGTASDDVGVTEVVLEIFDRDTGEWWDGSLWQVDRSSFVAVLDDAGASSTGWSYSFDPPVPASAPYWVTVRAFDAAMNASAHVYTNFIVTEGAMGPEARIDVDCGGVVGVENDTIPLSVLPGEFQTCSLDAARSFDPDGGSVVSWQWLVNGDPIGSSQVASFDYHAGTHNTLLTVTDDEGATGDIGVTIIVTEGA
jgi:hypothetical protein